MAAIARPSTRKGKATATYIWGLARLRPDMAGRMDVGADLEKIGARRAVQGD